MIIVQLTGGLGNQLFQYAAAKALSLKNKTTLVLDISSFYREKLPELDVPRNFELGNFLGVNEETITKSPFKNHRFQFLKKRFYDLIPAKKRKIYKEPHFHYDPNFSKIENDVYLNGVWQSEKYFADYKKEIRNALILKNHLYEKVAEFGKRLKSENSVSVHVRRGDYLRLKIIFEWHGVLGIDYYKTALTSLKSEKEPLQIYYFSDDPRWVEENLQPIFPGEIVSGSISQTHYEDLYLMSCCRHNIIANSSFSWWAAWFNDNPNKKVIAPLKWFDKAGYDTSDLIPEGWTRI